MALIDGLIQPQQFEVIRDRIALILTEELGNQKTLGLTELSRWDDRVWMDRVVAYDEVEHTAINVSLSNGTYDSESIVSSKGTYIFNIDILVRSKETETTPADELACKKLDRIAGVIRAILKAPVYDTLDFDKPSLYGTSIKTFNRGLADPKDADSSKAIRIEFEVVAEETITLDEGVPIGSHYTSVKLDISEKGYCWEYVNTEPTRYIRQSGEFIVSQLGAQFISNN